MEMRANNKIRESMDILIGYYTASIKLNTIMFETETMPKGIIQKRIENDVLVLDILEEDYQILFGGDE